MINARGGLSGRVRRKSNRGFDVHRDSHVYANRSTEEERFPDLKPGFNKPACCAVLIGLVIFVGGLGMTVLGYYAGKLTSSNENGAEVVGNNPKNQHLYNFRIVGPIIMGCGIFTILCACVVLQEAREKKKIVRLKKDTHVTHIPRYRTVTSKNTRNDSLDVVPGTSGISHLHPCNLEKSRTSMRSDSLAVPGHSVPSLLFPDDQARVPPLRSPDNQLSLSQQLAISQERFKVPNSPMIMIHRSSMADLNMLTPVDGDKSFSYCNDAYQTNGSDSSKKANAGSSHNSFQGISSSESDSQGSFTESKSNSSDEGEQQEKPTPGGGRNEYENLKRNSRDYFEKPNLLQATLTTTRRLSITSMLSASTIDSVDEEVLLKATMMMEDVTKQTVTIPANTEYCDSFPGKSNAKQKYFESELEERNMQAPIVPGTYKDGYQNTDYPVIYVDSHSDHQDFDSSVKTEALDAPNGNHSPVNNRGDPTISERNQHSNKPVEHSPRQRKERGNRSKEKKRPKSGSGRILVRQEKHLEVHSSDSDDGNTMNKVYRTHLREIEYNGNVMPDELEMTTFQSKGIQVDKHDCDDQVSDTYCGVEIVRENPPLNSDVTDDQVRDLALSQSTIRTRPSIEYTDGIREVTL